MSILLIGLNHRTAPVEVREQLAEMRQERRPVTVQGMRTNVVGGTIGEGTGGVTEGLKRRVVLPLAAFAVNGLVAVLTSRPGRHAPHGLVHTVACLGPFVSFLVSAWAFLQLRGMPEETRFLSQRLFEWISSGSLTGAAAATCRTGLVRGGSAESLNRT